MKNVLRLSAVLVCLMAVARPANLPDYGTMVDKAHLVAIATPMERKELKGLTTVPGVRRGNDPILGGGVPKHSLGVARKQQTSACLPLVREAKGYT